MKRLQEIYPALEHVQRVGSQPEQRNPVTHPSLTLLNAARIENTRGEVPFLSRRHLASLVRSTRGLTWKDSLSAKRGFKQIPATERLYRRYAIEFTPPCWKLPASQAFAPIKAPKSLDESYINEDLPMGRHFHFPRRYAEYTMERQKNILALGSLIRVEILARSVTMAHTGS